nr:bifunctional diguanylate cyclase/phosphodiesterase [Ciceribacter sp. L1K23]
MALIGPRAETTADVSFASAAALCSALASAALISHVLPFTSIWRQFRAQREKAERRANIDDLSGCLNRRRFMEILDQRLSDITSRQIRRQQTQDLTLLLIDVDHFKMINDGFGHASGDDVLRALGRRALAESGWTAGRLGGDEFAIIVDDTDHRSLDHRIRRFCQELAAELRDKEKTRGYQGVSIGVASAPADAANSHDLLNKADVALYVGKRNGRGNITYYHKDMEREHAEQRQIARDLQAALLLDQLELHYQPIVGLDGELAAVEALLRWRNNVGGYVPPDKFVRVAEQSDMIDRLGEWVFRRACRDLKAVDFPRVSVNVSGAQLKNDRLVPMLRTVLRETRCDASRFTLEITETVVLRATPAVLRTLRELRAMGFLIALDDFGTGNNSFALLRDLPVDFIKIDKSYTQRLETDKISQVFVTAVGEIAKALGMSVVAEGIETEEQHACARIAGAVRFQGYLHGKAQPPRAVASIAGQAAG